MRRVIFLWFGLSVLLLTGAAVFWSWWSRPVLLSVAVGANESDISKLMTAFAREFAQSRNGVMLKVVNYPDPLSAAEAFRSGKTDLGVIRGDMPLRGATAIAVLRKNVVLILAPEKTKLADLLKRKKVRLGVIGQPGVNEPVVAAIVKAYASDARAIEIVPISAEQAVQAFDENKVDAVLGAGPLQGARQWESLRATLRSKKTKLALVELDRNAVIGGAEPAYEEFEIPEGAVASNPPIPADALKSMSVSTYLVAHPTLREGVASSLAREIVSEKQDIVAEVPTAAMIEAPSTDKDALLRAHPGAAAYFDGEEQTFFDKYGDMIYYGGAALGLLGSAMLALSRRFGAGRDSEASQLVSRLLDLRRRAKALGRDDAADPGETSAAELWTKLAGEYEEMLAHALPLMSEGSVEDRTVQALSMALRSAERAVDEAALRSLRSR